MPTIQNVVQVVINNRQKPLSVSLPDSGGLPSGGGGLPSISCAGAGSLIMITNHIGNSNGIDAKFSVSVNGVLYNADKSLDLWDIPELQDTISAYGDSGGNLYIQLQVAGEYRIILSPSAVQALYSHGYPSGYELPEGTMVGNDFYFCLVSTITLPKW